MKGGGKSLTSKKSGSIWGKRLKGGGKSGEGQCTDLAPVRNRTRGRVVCSRKILAEKGGKAGKSVKKLVGRDGEAKGKKGRFYRRRLGGFT